MFKFKISFFFLFLFITYYLPFPVSFTYASSILEQPIGVRCLGLGETFSGLNSDLSDIFWNPAGLYNIKNKEINLNYYNSFMDTALTGVLFGTKLKNNAGSIGAGFVSYDGGSMEIVDENDNAVTVKALSESLGIVSYSNRVIEISDEKSLIMGANFKTLQSKLVEQYSAQAYAVDLGLLYRYVNDKNFSFGIAVQNIGSQLKYFETAEQLPVKLRISIGYNIIQMLLYNLQVLAETTNNMQDRQQETSLGAEYTYARLVSFRVGYKTGNMDKLTYGMGINIKGYVFDYGKVLLGSIENMDQLSLGIKF
ncbi:MAG: hypothetical protein A2252_02240 [Elusimicrobia bacterium RIFOXYA2_FULL_39_19]|nr:MAG: hypothetical protein A2252_02240 [Elusimicrobia bacterium RIFOXYA2_FULL_39_19]